MCMRPLSILGGRNYHQFTLLSKMQSMALSFSKELQTREFYSLSLNHIDRVRGMMLIGGKWVEEG